MTQIEHTQLPTPTRVGQGTVVEQTRATAEVLAAVQVAQQCPRSINAAISTMKQSCSQKGLAERAFYSYPKAGNTIAGPSVHLARELARCFGNFQSGITELRRDDEFRQSEMLAFAWDVETNSRSSLIFIVPHKRDKRGGPENLVELRDVYENNTNQGARRLRTVIFGLLPPWFVDQAVELCSQTLRDGGGMPLPRRIASAVQMYEQIGVTVDQLEQHTSRHPDRWTEHDLAKVGITYRSIERGELIQDEVFPPQRVTAAEITGNAPAAAPAPAAPEFPCEACGPLANHAEGNCPRVAGGE